MDRVNGEWALANVDKLRGKVLEVGSQIVQGQEHISLRGFIQKYTSEYVGLDGYPNNGVDVVADAINMPFSNCSFDSVITLDMLEHCKYPHDVFKEMYRVTKPGGYLLAATVFSFCIHSFPGDFFRFTQSALKFLAEDAGYEVIECPPDTDFTNPSIVRIIARKPL